MERRSWIEEREGDPQFEFDLLAIELGEAIEARMSQLCISRSELARRMGVSRPRITQVLAGDDNLTLKSLVAVANALDAWMKVVLTPRCESLDDWRRPENWTAIRMEPPTGLTGAEIMEAA